MANRRAPKEMQKYAVVQTIKQKNPDAVTQNFKYFRTKKEAVAFAENKPGIRSIFKINYDFVGDVE